MANRIKVVLLGASSVGKSTLIDRIVLDKFVQNETTIGAAFHQMYLNGHKLNIWDTAGQERYLSIIPIYYRNTDIVILVYDLGSISTVSRALYYFNKLKKELGNNINCIIVGNKKDLINEQELMLIKRYINKTFENKTNTEFKYVSSKTGENIKELKDCISHISDLIDNDIDRIINNDIVLFEDNINSDKCDCV